jgi:phosphoribosylaminoimidazole-succinocarboxamide synthase
MASAGISNVELKGIKKFRSGKVRDIYDLGDSLLFVASDRISAYDHILPNPIPDKGKVLNLLSLFWFDYLKDVVKNHLITANVEDYPKEFKKHKDMLKNRSMIVRKVNIVPIECVVRGYLAGSGWKEYQESKTVCGIKLPDGLVQASKLTKAIFTPATKEEAGHDINITEEKMKDIIGKDLAVKIIKASIGAYTRAADYAAKRGVILCDTKFEFGLLDGEIILADEVLTPDSSRFWQADTYKPGTSPKSFDKQFVRDYLDEIKWDRNPPVPQLPEGIISKTREKYIEAYEKITGKKFPIE